MAVSGIGSSSGTGASSGLGSSSSSSSNDVVQEFLSYMKETPAQRMEDSWLAAHGITKQAFDAMSPEQKAKIIAQMKQDIENQIKKSTDAKTSKESSSLMR